MSSFPGKRGEHLTKGAFFSQQIPQHILVFFIVWLGFIDPTALGFALDHP
jgi:hypothetical protein